MSNTGWMGLCLIAIQYPVAAKEVRPSLSVVLHDLSATDIDDDMVALRPKNGYLHVIGNHQVTVGFEIEVPLAALTPEEPLPEKPRFDGIRVKSFGMVDRQGHRYVAPPTVNLEIKRWVGNKFVAMPVKPRPFGMDSFQLHLPYPDEVRKKRIKKFVDQVMQEESKSEVKPRPLSDKAVSEFMIRDLEENGIDNRPGDYLIVATYTSRGKDFWNGTLRSQPIKIRVVGHDGLSETQKKPKPNSNSRMPH